MRAVIFLVGLFGVISLFAASCGGPGQGAERGVASLTIHSDPPNPKVFVDGVYLGELQRWREWTIPVPADAKRLELRAEGYYPHKRDLRLQDGSSYQLDVSLVWQYE
ncbi:MAG: hypothetical protein CO108_00585 [Deltaproteobacteria bacterium CG_4_9_14_3_um_filter_63_12]|nr:MAG: hypothetical protein CO108_00585 [Deltaproteobacteria bacterium CG_4_9_14_3_um_filter_63_12]